MEQYRACVINLDNPSQNHESTLSQLNHLLRQATSNEAPTRRIILLQLAPYVEDGKHMTNPSLSSNTSLLDDLFTIISHFKLADSALLDHTHLGNNPFRFTSNFTTPKLPSEHNQQTRFSVPYYELRTIERSDWDARQFVNPITREFGVTCAGTGRHIQVQELRDESLKKPLMIVPRKCSFWSKMRENGGWDAMIICDPPLKFVSVEGHGSSQKDVRLNLPMNDGYRNFMHDEEAKAGGPQQASLFDDLRYYYSNYSASMSDTNLPSCVTLFIAKILSAHYAMALGFLEHQVSSLSSRGWSIGKNTEDGSAVCDHFYDDWLTFRHAPIRRDLEQVMDAMGVARENPIISSSWTDWGNDLKWLRRQLIDCSAQYADLTAAMAAKSGVVTEEQNVREQIKSNREARLVTLLSIILLIFAPMTLVASLFGMTDGFAPGQPGFKSYWIVALPVTVLIVMLVGAGFWIGPLNRQSWSRYWHRIPRLASSNTTGGAGSENHQMNRYNREDVEV